jgi:hypothetical protein
MERPGEAFKSHRFLGAARAMHSSSCSRWTAKRGCGRDNSRRGQQLDQRYPLREVAFDVPAGLAVANAIHGSSLSSDINWMVAMNSPANDNSIISNARMIHLLHTMLEKMQSELPEAEGTRKRALLKLIGMGQKRLADLKRTYH